MAKPDRQRGKEKEEYWKTVQTVQLGETFLLFDTTRNYADIRYGDDGSFGGIKSSLRLETRLLETLHISITTPPYIIERHSVITPFNREQGYPLDKDDLTLRSRQAKISKFKREHPETIEGLYLFVFVTYEDMSLHGMMRAFLDDGTPAREVAFILHRLFLTLAFPNGSSFTARAWSNTNRLFLLFDRFFPADTGPLPQLGSAQNAENDRSEGFNLLVPFDLEKLKTIKAKFLFLPDQE